ncbi:MAG: hypothetical protein D6736_20695 [Nitrospinota bacterium]|nr:MAG: hypothetical protein D6736_20695 [Nitrospinota bacterium]
MLPKYVPIIGLLLILLTTWSRGWSASKQGFPPLDTHDFSYYLPHDSSPGSSLYLYSTLSFLGLNRDELEFSITPHQVPGVTPLLSLSPYPPLEYPLQSEFLDFTIWGQLGNYFNREIELIALENEIMAILKELKAINERYRALLNTEPNRSWVKYAITLDSRHYLHAGERKEKEEEGEEVAVGGAGGGGPRVLYHLLRSQLPGQGGGGGVQMTGSSLLGPSPPAVTLMTAPEQKLDPSTSMENSLVIRIFNKMMALIRYLMENKGEALIYLGFLLLLSTAVKAMFER